ncbi:MAG: DUF5060 domain-containing protein [Armatimonadetes bacterium]|nr:DUF5060 domain-containing protein [Armatimonadota bacterium]
MDSDHGLFSALYVAGSHARFRQAACLLVALMAAGCLPAHPGQAAGAPLAVRHWQNTSAVPPYEVFEITFQHDETYENPFFDVTIDVTFTSPTGEQVKIGGFHYGSLNKPQIRVREGPGGRGRRQVEYVFDKANIWKARFTPAEIGRWTYAYVFTNVKGERTTGNGTFTCVKGRIRNPGFVRQDLRNPFLWVFDDGSPFFPIGLQDGCFDNAGVGSVLADYALEGPFRLDRQGRPAPPPGAIFKPGPAPNPQNGDVYFRRYGRCGFNLLRFSQQNFSLPLYRDLDHYLPQECVMVDELLQHARKYGFRILYGIFGYQPVFNEHPEDAAGMAKVKRFVKYSVDRWGAYVDFWEFLNEQKAQDRWYEIMAPYLRSLDPYHHPITTSWERPDLPGIEVSAPHWYVGINNELTCDQETASQAAGWKQFRKPVIVDETGNWASKEQLRTPGIGGVWDTGSALRMRLRNWSALFHQISFVFWNTSYARDGHYMNIWLGPKEREYVRAMQSYAYSLGGGTRMAEVAVSDPHLVRAYGLASQTGAGVYLHHFQDHTSAVRGLTVTLEVPRRAKGYWYSPENAAILQTFDAPAGRQTFAVPAFTVDIALLITSKGAPDIDKDGKPNDVDPDDDNDGVPDARDAFPLEPEEWADKDGDLIGDNLDADKDGDGVGDDDNRNGIPDGEEMDLDGDGVPRATAVPWDAFPLDRREWRDTDGDGTGDNADKDDDGDGYPDAIEKQAGTNPLDRLQFPAQ